MLPAADIERIFHVARRKSSAERPAFLKSACGADSDSIALLESMLTFNDSASDFLETPAAELMGLNGPQHIREGLPSDGRLSTQSWIGAQVGNYWVVRVIAAGGMGIVYEAEQAAPRRKVALKLMSRALDSGAAVQRFNREAELLGRLRHVGVAQIYEAGIHREDGPPTPFFAMEYLAGAAPITDFAKAQSLGVGERLSLMCGVCDAVQYCHEQGVIHRDLKPGNILVGPNGEPKVIDFGVAQLQAVESATAAWHTTGHPLLGSLAYMSPEQAGIDNQVVDAQSDVYALGVITYELLADRLPLELAELSPLEAVRRIRDEEPLSLGRVDARYRGDLETIVSTAMAKEKPRRYPSAKALAADLRRYLHNEPVQARRAGPVYRARKFVRRNVALTVALTVAFAGLLIGGVIAAMQAHTATVQRDRAENALAESQAVTEFVRSILAQANPKAYGQDHSIRDALDRAGPRIEVEFARAPRIRAAIHEAVAEAYWGIGELKTAKEHFGLALASHEVARPFDERAQHVTAIELVRLLLYTGELTEADANLAKLEAQSCSPQQHPLVTSNLLSLRAQLLRTQRDYPGAIELFYAARELRRQVPGDQRVPVAEYTMQLAQTMWEEGRDQESPIELARDAVSVFHNVLGAESAHTVWGKRDLAHFLAGRGREDDLVEAEGLLRDAVREQTRISGETSLEVAIMTSELGSVLASQGRLKEAHDDLLRALELKRTLLGDNHLEVAQTAFNLGKFLARIGDYAQAMLFLEDSVQIRRQKLAPLHPDLALTLRLLAHVTFAAGDASMAESLYRESLDSSSQLLGARHPDLVQVLADLSATLIAQQSYADAEELLGTAIAIYEQASPDVRPPSQTLHDAMGLLGEALAGLGEEFALKEEELAIELFTQAEELLLDSYSGIIDDPYGPERARSMGIDGRAQAVGRMANLYGAWHAVQPEAGFDSMAATWRDHLDERRTFTPPPVP